MRWAWVVLLALVPGRAVADRLDHRGALGLEVAPGFEYAATALAGTGPELSRGRLLLDLAPTFGVFPEGDDLVVTLRLVRGGNWGGAAGVAYRDYFGRDELKTFVDLGLQLDMRPTWTVGPAAGLGVMYELSPLAGLFGRAMIDFGAGDGLRFGGGFQLGVQARTYVLE